jgi:hypothetical protein
MGLDERLNRLEERAGVGGEGVCQCPANTDVRSYPGENSEQDAADDREVKTCDLCGRTRLRINVVYTHQWRNEEARG